MSPALSCQSLDVAIGELELIAALDLSVAAGETLCVIGCNGAGKTTLLHTLAGLRNHCDRIGLRGKAMTQLSRRAIARELALLLQHHDDAFPTTVMDAVLAARHPYQSMLSVDTVDDRSIAMTELSKLELDHLAGRDLATLSGGERQRVAIAATFAQRPAVMLLDEPLNNLDPRHQLQVMERLVQATHAGVATIAVMHDLNLVMRHADRVLLLYGPAHDGEWICAPTDKAMTSDNLTRLYGVTIRVARVGERQFFYTGWR